ncbi:hypothetical protein L2E82_00095 [Cichorium intybus]|uniref:Uncharacterized protein n=1 Tax=Cichorium intybus TaxID=13427 RepID=A0ACB9GWG5_CICIN|nr:hypothetical protein L2E82_00095 [Cichorium intybus]
MTPIMAASSREQKQSLPCFQLERFSTSANHEQMLHRASMAAGGMKVEANMGSENFNDEEKAIVAAVLGTEHLIT